MGILNLTPTPMVRNRRNNVLIHPSAIVNESASIHKSVQIGANCYIADCQIGKDTKIHENVHIYSNVCIGKRVIINTGAIIGVPGMQFRRDYLGRLVEGKHTGGIVIEDDVYIGAGTIIVRGVTKDTIIRRGTKIGILCLIGHQSITGKHCIILSHSMLGGSCQIGDYSRVSMKACVRERRTIGRNVFIGMGAVVTKDIPDSVMAYGVPAKVMKTLNNRYITRRRRSPRLSQKDPKK
jgi:UDP-3-O-[3-hydroxymyristoyl] glucosamine N-acyltransferase